MNLRRLIVAWHKLRRHNVRDLGHPLGQHRIWCYHCAADLIPWNGNPRNDTEWFAAALRERVMAGDELALQCAYLLGCWADGLWNEDCTAVENGDVEKPCGACYFCQTLAAADVEREWGQAQKEKQDAV